MATKKPKQNYVDKAKFSQEVHDYVVLLNKAKEKGEELPIIPNSIADAFIKICNGASLQKSFKDYSFREGMVNDAIENCLRAIGNYNIDAPTRSGKPNAFGYFTQIALWAFLRKIAKEKKQAKAKNNFMRSSNFAESVFIDDNIQGTTAEYVTKSYLESVQIKFDEWTMDSSFDSLDHAVRDSDDAEGKSKSKPMVVIDSDLEEFFK